MPQLKMKGGACGGAADYGVYVWGQNQMVGQGEGGNIIQPVNDPRLFGQPMKGGKRRRYMKGGNPTTAAPLFSPSETDTSAMAAGAANKQIMQMMQPVVSNVSTDSVNPAARQTGGKKKRISRKKIYSKNKRHNGRNKRRTSKIR